MSDTDPNSFSETGVWREIHGTWQQLHGSFPDLGLSLEWHDFRLDHDMDWGRSFHPGSLEICLNFSGSGFLKNGAAEQPFGPSQVIIYALRGKPLRAQRDAATLHRFLTIEISPAFLRTHFSGDLPHLKPAIRDLVESNTNSAPWVEIMPLPSGLLPARLQFVQPPVPVPARRVWFLGRVFDILAQTIFADVPAPAAELFCEKHHRTNRDRVQRVCFLIERDLENPPTLEMLAKEAGCSPYHLSRIFARETGGSIPRFLRMKRIEKAAARIKSREMNVTEAAMSVGYSSLGSFTKAFVEQMGCCPGLYPIGKLSRPVKRAIR